MIYSTLHKSHGEAGRRTEAGTTKKEYATKEEAGCGTGLRCETWMESLRGIYRRGEKGDRLDEMIDG
jgi:hypothetical protein